MRFNVGDKVTVIDHRIQMAFGWAEEMDNYFNKQLTIKHCTGSGYKVEENGYTWTDECFQEEKEMGNWVERLNKEQLMQEGFNILEQYDYSPTKHGMEAIWNTYVEQKSTPICGDKSLFDLLAAHPNYVPEKGYIVFSNEYEKPINFDLIYRLMDDFATYGIGNILVPIKIGVFEYKELSKIIERLEGKINSINEMKRYYGAKNVSVDGMTYEELKRELEKFKKLRRNYDYNNSVYVSGVSTYTRESYELREKVYNLLIRIKNWINNHRELEVLVSTDEIMNMVVNSGLEIRGLRSGQPLNKFIGKILREFGVDKWEDYNRQFARLGEAIKPTTFTRHTVISANWIDYWAMSFGNSWTSCHTIDKENIRDRGGDTYSGMHSSGTESYMLDPSTVVVYTVDSEYDGNDFELEDKINRCMFHIGENKFVMGRVYPQGTDGAEPVYKQWREMFQSVMSVCMGVPNYWKTEKDLSRKLEQINSYGTHYRDYEYNYCNIAGWSWAKPTADSYPSEKRIEIGHSPICPKCGSVHYTDNNIQCCGIEHECYQCGCSESEENMHYINGDWYCEDCCFYCEYHDEWEIGDYTYVENYGNVCDDALNYSDDFGYCDRCDTYFSYRDSDYVVTEGGTYCCEDCARDAGYIYVESTGNWEDEEDVTYCSECDEYVLNDDYNEELGMCNSCASNREEEE